MIEQDIENNKLDFENKDLKFLVGGITLIQDAFSGRLQGGFHQKPYYKLLGIKLLKYDDPDASFEVRTSINVPLEIDTDSVMTIDLLLLLGSVNT